MQRYRVRCSDQSDGDKHQRELYSHIKRSPPAAQRSLRHACLKCITQGIRATTVLNILQFARKFGHAVAGIQELEIACLTFIRNCYQSVREEHGVPALRALLGNDVVEAYEQADRFFVHYRKLLRVRGRALEPSVSYKEGDSVGGKGINPTSVPSVVGRTHRSYPYEWLLAGKQWPDDVDPTRRERYLEASRFMALFGMTYASFAALPAWRQLLLKREAQLF